MQLVEKLVRGRRAGAAYTLAQGRRSGVEYILRGRRAGAVLNLLALGRTKISHTYLGPASS
jgi:hypothetical protein